MEKPYIASNLPAAVANLCDVSSNPAMEMSINSTSFAAMGGDDLSSAQVFGEEISAPSNANLYGTNKIPAMVDLHEVDMDQAVVDSCDDETISVVVYPSEVDCDTVTSSGGGPDSQVVSTPVTDSSNDVATFPIVRTPVMDSLNGVTTSPIVSTPIMGSSKGVASIPIVSTPVTDSSNDVATVSMANGSNDVCEDTLIPTTSAVDSVSTVSTSAITDSHNADDVEEDSNTNNDKVMAKQNNVDSGFVEVSDADEGCSVTEAYVVIVPGKSSDGVAADSASDISSAHVNDTYERCDVSNEIVVVENTSQLQDQNDTCSVTVCADKNLKENVIKPSDNTLVESVTDSTENQSVSLRSSPVYVASAGMDSSLITVEEKRCARISPIPCQTDSACLGSEICSVTCPDDETTDKEQKNYSLDTDCDNVSEDVGEHHATIADDFEDSGKGTSTCGKENPIPILRVVEASGKNQELCEENNKLDLQDNLSDSRDTFGLLNNIRRDLSVTENKERLTASDDSELSVPQHTQGSSTVCRDCCSRGCHSGKEKSENVTDQNSDVACQCNERKDKEGVSFEYYETGRASLHVAPFTDAVNKNVSQKFCSDSMSNTGNVDEKGDKVVSDDEDNSCMTVDICDDEDVMSCTSTVKDMDLNDVSSVKDDDMMDEQGYEGDANSLMNHPMKDDQNKYVFGTMYSKNMIDGLKLKNEVEIENAFDLTDGKNKETVNKDVCMADAYSFGDTDDSDICSVMSDETVKEKMSITSGFRYDYSSDDYGDNDEVDDDMSDSITVKNMDVSDAYYARDDDEMSDIQNTDDGYFGTLKNVTSGKGDSEMFGVSDVKLDDEIDMLQNTDALESDDSLIDDRMSYVAEVNASVYRRIREMKIANIEKAVAISDCNMRDDLSTGTMNISDITEIVAMIDDDNDESDDMSDSSTLNDDAVMNDMQSLSDFEEMKSVLDAMDEIDMNDFCAVLDGSQDGTDYVECPESLRDVVMADSPGLKNGKIIDLDKPSNTHTAYMCDLSDELDVNVIDSKDNTMGDCLMNIVMAMNDVVISDTRNFTKDIAVFANTEGDAEMFLVVKDNAEMSVDSESDDDEDRMSVSSSVRSDAEMCDGISTSNNRCRTGLHENTIKRKFTLEVSGKVAANGFSAYHTKKALLSKMSNYSKMDEESSSMSDMGMITR